MAHGGKRPGAGRKNGSKARKTICVQEKLEKLGCDPIEGMVEIAREAMAKEDYTLAASMFKELAQYVAPKRKAVEISGDQENPIQTVSKIVREIVDTKKESS